MIEISSLISYYHAVFNDILDQMWKPIDENGPMRYVMATLSRQMPTKSTHSGANPHKKPSSSMRRMPTTHQKDACRFAQGQGWGFNTATATS